MKLILNKTLRLVVALALAAPTPAFAGAVSQPLKAVAPLPVLKAVAVPVLIPVLSHEQPQQAVIPKVFEPSTLDAAKAAEVSAVPLPMAGAESLGRSLLTPHRGHDHSGGGAGRQGPPPGRDGELRSMRKALFWSAGPIAVELAGGLMLDSLALRADALHLTADWGLNLLAYFVMSLARREGAGERLKKLEPVVGLLSSAVIAYTAFEIGKEALERLAAPMEFSAPAVILLALCGLAANGVATAILYKHREGGLGARSVFLHAMTDAAGSLAVALSAALAWAFAWSWADPAASALVVLLISKTAFDLARQSWKALRARSTPTS